MSSQNTPPTLSQRAAVSIAGATYPTPFDEALLSPWSRENPDGTVMLGLAENYLVHDELEDHIQTHFAIEKRMHFTFGHGPGGSPKLLEALPNFLNAQFHPRVPTKPIEFVVTSGVSAVADHLAWCICNPGEGMLLPMPVYAGHPSDIETRSNGVAVSVHFEREDGTLNLDDVFDADANTKCLERAFRKSEQEGVKIKGVMIVNPHNPLGRCYPVETLKSIARFCASHNIHYLSDEIYACSTFLNPSYPKAAPFTSILSVDLDSIIAPDLVHVLYGASKDFSAIGLRLGVLHTRNTPLRDAVREISTFARQPYIVQDMWARMLSDRPFLDAFFSENHRRLATHYQIITKFLDSHGIPYYAGGNAGFYVWIDLRQKLLGTGPNAANLASLKPSSPDYAKHLAKEAEIANACVKRGVMITKGSSCMSEEVGWFRVVFTRDEATLMVGLERIVAALKGLEEAGRL